MDQLITLLSKYTISQLLLMILFLAAAIKGVWSFIDWMMEKRGNSIGRQIAKRKQKEQVNQRLEKDEKTIQNLTKSQQKILDNITTLTDKIDLLIQSDKQDIKAFITRQHHYFCYQKHWIDDYSLQCCEKRYTYYLKQKGNSFVGTLMDQLRALPKVPPQTINNNSSSQE